MAQTVLCGLIMNNKLGVAACVLLASACVPPGATLATEGTMRAPQGSTSGSAALAYIGEFTGPVGLAGGARVSHQVVRNVAIAGEAAFGGQVLSGLGASSLVGGGARVSTRVSPDTDHFAVTGGIGGGYGATNAGFVTFDVGVRVGWNYQRRVELFAGQSFGMGVRVPTPSAGSNPSSPGDFNSVTEIGVLVRPTERFSLGASLSMTALLGVHGRSLTERPLFIPGISAGYTFGGRGARSLWAACIRAPLGRGPASFSARE